MASAVHAVTGAFGYSGRYIAQRLLASGRRVITLTNSLSRAHEFGDAIEAYPLRFDDADGLARSLEGVEVLYNTYWVRFNHAMFKHAEAVLNTQALFAAAKKAGVGRIVHISITNPSMESKLEYFHGKAVLEEALTGLGLSYAILRPAVIFGKEDILINNIAWMLRRLPVIGVFGDGRYRLQPIYVEDLAELAIRAGEATENHVINAIGPETFTYRELVATLARILGVRRLILPIPPALGYIGAKVLGAMVGDVVLTREEIEGLMADLLYVEGAPPAGTTKLTEWATSCAATLGQRYTSELARRKDRVHRYASN